MAIRFGALAGSAADAVAIFYEAGLQAFSGARPIRVSVGPSIKYMTHPQEDGGNVTDHRIIEPDTVVIGMILEPATYRQTYQEIKTAARASVPLIVQTRSDTFVNMYIDSYPSEEDPALFDTITMNISFREIQTEAAQIQTLPAESVENSADSSTVDRGTQNGSADTPVQTESSEGSILSDVFR